VAPDRLLVGAIYARNQPVVEGCLLLIAGIYVLAKSTCSIRCAIRA
jgi:hypothetical protein